MYCGIQRVSKSCLFALFNFLVLKLSGVSSLFHFYNVFVLFSSVNFIVIFNLVMFKFYLFFFTFLEFNWFIEKFSLSLVLW